ncbi:MAG: hypothetical protein BRC24_00165, partial [Parcubacteria group bacterium SW_4_46_8]
MEKQVLELGDLELVKGEPFVYDSTIKFGWNQPIVSESGELKVQGYWEWPSPNDSNRNTPFCIRVFPPRKNDGDWMIDSHPDMGISLHFCEWA